ncbi:MAG: alpha/beta fold hydrolase [Chloroflexota bacterium]
MILARLTTGPRRARLPVVLVHGLGVSSRYMTPLMRALAPTFDVYAPDLPGFGRSPKPGRALTIPQLASALDAWLDVAGLTCSVLIGHSMGCQVVIELAQRRPQRADRLVLLSPTMDDEARTALRQCWRLARDAPREPLAEWVITGCDYLRSGLRHNWRTLQYALSDPVKDKLPHLTLPTLVVRGERDPIVSPDWAAEVARRLPDGRLVVLPGAPHAMNYCRPALLATAIVPFLLER